MDSRICQTLSASPAKPGGLPEALVNKNHSQQEDDGHDDVGENQ